MTSTHYVMARALLDPTAALPPGLRAWNGSDPAVRFDVYRNNVTTSLVAALADTFPVVSELVGSDFFGAMAREFVRRHSPASPLLAEYGSTFARFIEGFEPAGSVPYLADVARLEFARVQAWHAADAAALDATTIAGKLADTPALPAACMVLQPATAIIASPFAIVSLWAAHQGHGDITQVDPLVPQAALVLRENDEVIVLGLPHANAFFIAKLASGHMLGEAAAAAAQHRGGDGQPFDLSAALGLLLAHGAITEWKSP
jgi:hypothetical protein